ncbi:1-3-beta-glucanosyltransferase gel2 [Penicillium atrosanguineum]|uniref:1-3-beta-glucanosyltransferase gel2 n=1 Tax=Penicillium atrosanguineum TaxID=1132637 RepID=UPI0023A5C41E|nr:1-3-beta-glucanosyltransferase gel2 [Penicillium atrosanguineum]KAJ5313221.1 1-3-beta-glucanosyltransferase gel2 [Penicillium atrosanguineum]
MPVIAYHVLHLIWVFRLGPIEFLGTAEQLVVQAMEARNTKLGEDHPDMLISMNNLASTYMKQGRWEEAEQLEVQVMETRKTKLGEDHPDTLTSMANLAFTWKSSGHDAKAVN